MTQEQLDQVWADHKAKKPHPGQEKCTTAPDVSTDFIHKDDEGWERLPGQKPWREVAPSLLHRQKRTVL